MKRLVYIVVVLIFLSGCSDRKNQKILRSISTPVEKAKFQQLTKHSEIINYLERVDSLSKILKLEYVGESVNGKKIPLVKISWPDEDKKEKTTVFFLAQQHGDEPSGKEGMLLFIDAILDGNHDKWLKKIDLLIMPQVNPDGGDLNKRRNANGVDLNRDHLVLKAPETQTVHNVFNKYEPEVTVDIHEYTAYSRRWKEFGYIKDFDIQLGSLTNKNIDPRLKDLFYNEIKPFVGEKLGEEEYTFFEYTLGDLPEGGRLRRSTVDVNDGRQSFGILNTLSFIVEGKMGKDSVDNLERRAKSQFATARSLVDYVYKNEEKVRNIVTSARDQLIHSKKGEKVSIRMQHVRGDEPLKYPLKSISTGEDTIFTVKEYHSEIKSLLDIEKPFAYLISAKDEKLKNWLDRSHIKYYKYQPFEDNEVKQYKLTALQIRVDEGLKNYYPKVELNEYTDQISKDEYYYVPLTQLRSNKIVTALEPQSMIGLINYPEFEYLIKQSQYYPVLRYNRPQ